jgi:type II secretory pathway pseudopilin PulG
MILRTASNGSLAVAPRARFRSRAFTVLEVIMAVTLFSIVSLVIFAIFRSAVDSQSAADRHTRVIQQARFALDSIGKDITNVYFRDETSYNVAIAEQIEQMEAARLQAEASNDWSNFYAIYGDPNIDDKDESPSVGDPYNNGRIIDLQMEGAADSLTLAVQTPLQVGGYYRPWGLSRVEYKLSGGLLVRSAQSVEVERRDINGERVEQPRLPEVARVADNVAKISFGYLFWFDSQWYEADAWSSTNRQIRNPRYLLGTYDDDNSRTSGETNPGESAFGPGSPGFNDSLNDSDSEPLDRLPSMIRVTIEMGDEKKWGRIQPFTALFRVPTSQETWAPMEEFDDDKRESEQTLRDEQYVVVYPGVTRPAR